ncbi:hypothetical protein CPB84DRAFT_1788880 [Gymnopilus junonius]|uniref:Uncharacterized protein n=1 Tax=Gymnopilus junonius TaxID=109634 RepID=A0A9P5NFA4_GYMJU|nr:hypothetical protein CPB84DRAFT_1788880 [Gymnopilus junonius]
MMAFFHAQDDISKAIESVVFAHIIGSLPVEIRIQGKDYILKGTLKPERKVWKLGKTLDLTWGDRPIRPCDDKWTFIFELLESPESD